MYRYWLERWLERVDIAVANTILSSRAFAEGCAEVATGSYSQSSSKRHRRLSRHQSGLPAPVNVQSFLRRAEKVVSPTHPQLGEGKVILSGVRVKQSITKPIAIPLQWPDKKGYVLFKPEDVRKDHIVMNFIRLSERILKRELGIDFHIITYNVRPTSSEAGFIEMVDDSTTLYEIDSGNCNFFNFVDGGHQLDEIRQRFMLSTAAYCVLTFLLGAGDRHLHNIMLTKSGVLFHIDYGYVMGADPKRIGMLRVPDMRIDQDIVDALGPPEQFEEFQNWCDKIYNCLRRHAEVLTCLMRLLVLSKPHISVRNRFTEKKLMREILKRFAPGENHEQARIQIINRIHNSTRSTTHYAVVDALHHQAQTNPVLKAMASTWHSIKNSLRF